MAVFDINPYQTLGLQITATPDDVRKAYRKQCLRHHPDKVSPDATEEEKSVSKRVFEEVQFAHSILSDERKKKRYDDTGSLDELDSDSDFDWFEYFRNVKDSITEESIAKDKKIYQRSSDEESDIIECWIETNGDFLQLFEAIPHTEVSDEDEQRLFDKVEGLINECVIEPSDLFSKYKNSRRSQFNKLKNAAKKEAKAAEKAKKELAIQADSMADLRALMQQKKKNDMDSLISRLEEKYASKSSRVKKSTKKSKNSKKSV